MREGNRDERPRSSGENRSGRTSRTGESSRSRRSEPSISGREDDVVERQRGTEHLEGPGKPEFTRKEKQDYVEQVEEFEGPDRRETRGSPPEAPKEPGVARS